VSLKKVARELARYKLDLVDVQEVRCDEGGTVRAENYTRIFYDERNQNRQMGTGFFIHHRKISTVKRVDSFSDRM
jgi:exonuclease III